MKNVNFAPGDLTNPVKDILETAVQEEFEDLIEELRYEIVGKPAEFLIDEVISNEVNAAIENYKDY